MTEEQAQPQAATTVATNIAAVNVKLPPFWPADPQVWFVQVEAQFTTRGITQQRTKFDYIITSLTPEYATEVRDLILQPPAEAPYDTLKHQLIQRMAASVQRRLQQLFNAEELGDHKPTQLLRRMQQLLGIKQAPWTALFSANCSFNICQGTSAWCWPPPRTRLTWRTWPSWQTRLWRSLHPPSPLWAQPTSPMNLNGFVQRSPA